jgi:hypothetical protein
VPNRRGFFFTVITSLTLGEKLSSIAFVIVNLKLIRKQKSFLLKHCQLIDKKIVKNKS